MNYKNAVYNSQGTIDCEVEHPDFGWIPFTASSNDVEPFGKEVFDLLKDTAAMYVEGGLDDLPIR
jgi:hypothetical protein